MIVLPQGTDKHQAVIFLHGKGNDAVSVVTGVERSLGALDHSGLGDKEEELVFAECAQGKHIGHPFFFAQGDEVVDVHTFGSTAAFGHLMHLQLIHAALIGKETQELMVGCGQEILHIIVLGRMHTGNALAAAMLLLIVFKTRALDVAAP